MGEAKLNKKSHHHKSRKSSKSSITTIIVVVCILIVIGFDFFQRNQSSPLLTFDPQRAKGSAEASVKIIEFADFQCSECARGSRVINDYMRRFPTDIHLAMKYYPLGELNSTISAVYAQCAARQDKFWAYHDILFEKQSQWRTLLRVKKELTAMAQEVSVDVAKLETCVERKDVAATVESERVLGESNFVRSTPTYFINEEMFVGVGALQQYLKERFDNQSE